MDNVQNAEVLVIGGGTAGINAARQAIRVGARNVVVVHKPCRLNTCVEAGCMPSKSILAGAESGLSFKQIREDRDAHIDRLSRALQVGFKDEQFQLVEGTALFKDENTVVVRHNGEETIYESARCVIATGSSPFIPPIPGIKADGKQIFTSDDVVARKAPVTRIPKRLLVLGGGPIGLELATFFHRMGSHVTVVERSKLLSIFDHEVGEERLAAARATSGFEILVPASVLSVKKADDGISCTIECSDHAYDETFDALLVAAGRKANIEGLKLGNTGVEVKQGRIAHDEYLQTNQDGIFVAGDVVGHHQILHYAAEMGKVAGYNAASNNHPRRVDYDRYMLAVSFDMYPSALIGITEEEARRRGLDVLTATRRFDSIGLGILKRERFGLWKLVAERNSGKIIGSQIIGPSSAGELMQILVPIIHNGNTYGQILTMPWYHPTFGEIIKSLANDMCGQDNTFCPGM